MSPRGLPLIADYKPHRAFAWRNGGAVTSGLALQDILILADQLKPGRHYLNLCDDRYYFTVSFAAVCLAGATNLLAQSRAEGSLEDARSGYSDTADLDDEWVAERLARMDSGAAPEAAPDIDASHLAAVVFTSGSTGRPTPHSKYWGDLQACTGLFLQRFFEGRRGRNVVATVPPQHMYGLETSVLTVLQAGMTAHASRPFTPWDVAHALARIPTPRLLVTTPVHLHACLKADVEFPEVEMVLSATAPLSRELAGAAEARWKTRLCEIYGCTEAGSLASRRPTREETWTLYDGMTLNGSGPFELRASHLPEPVPLNDRLELLDDGRFLFKGRAEDMLKVAGKRLSLLALNNQLLSLEGVEDAVAFAPEGGQGDRAAALVVAPTVGVKAIAAELARRIDPVFVPRPIVRVEALPRNRVGKIPRGELEAMLRRSRE